MAYPGSRSIFPLNQGSTEGEQLHAANSAVLGKPFLPHSPHGTPAARLSACGLGIAVRVLVGCSARELRASLDVFCDEGG